MPYFGDVGVEALGNYFHEDFEHENGGGNLLKVLQDGGVEAFWVV